VTDLRVALLDAARRTEALGLNHGATGNLSCRSGSGMLITPTAVPYHRLDPASLVSLAFDGTVNGAGQPSSEWRLHAAVYLARPDIGAVVHTHSRFATTIACLREDLPAIHYMVAETGAASVRCAPYAPFGSDHLADLAVAALGPSRACLLANHGLVAAGAGLEEALRVALEVETVAEYWWRARAIGSPVLLTETEMADALARFRDYGASPGRQGVTIQDSRPAGGTEGALG
jgi:L-fuculose-phosphate aldolase